MALPACFGSSSVTRAGDRPSDLGDAGLPYDAGASTDGATSGASDGGGAGTGVDGSSGLIDGGTLASPAPGICVPTGSMSAPRSYALWGTLAAGGVLIAGGGKGLTSAEIYDPATGAFTPTGSLNVFRWSYPNSLVQLQDGRFLAAGGTDAACQTLWSSAEIYDPTTGTWSLTGSMGTARSAPILTGLADGRVLVRGGYGPPGSGACGVTTENALATAEIYDPSTGMFSPTGSAASPRAAASSVLLPDGDVLVTDGESYGNSPFNATSEIYSPASGMFTWSGATPGAAGYGFDYVLPSGKVLVSGSYSGGSISLFDPGTQTFTPAPNDAISGGGGCGVRLKNGNVFLATGLLDGTPTNQTEVYDSTSGTWIETGTMSTPRWVCTMAELPNGDVLVAGGNDPSGTALATAEVCNPNPQPGDGG